MQLDCSEIGMTMTIVKTTKDTNGQSLEMKWVLSPKSGGTPVHIHPHAIETYEILSGELQVYKKNKWLTVATGDKVIIEKGEPHTFRNITNQFVHVYNTHEPAMQFEDFFKGLHKFANSGLVKNGRMNLRSLMGVSTLWMNYQKEIVSVSPPASVMKILASAGRLAGMNYK